uniref:Uncharacterized protein n=1 Tax=Eptatretus burgeri TaxID=7764 RepID=A0A8C4QHA2_EPTBU
MGLECPTLLHHAVILGLIALLCHGELFVNFCHNSSMIFEISCYVIVFGPISLHGEKKKITEKNKNRVCYTLSKLKLMSFCRNEFIKETTTISNSNIEEKASTFKLVSPLMVLTGFLLSLAGVIALISLFRGLFLIIRKWKIDPYHKNKAGVNTAHVFPATQLCIEEGIYSDVDMRPRMTR